MGGRIRGWLTQLRGLLLVCSVGPRRVPGHRYGQGKLLQGIPQHSGQGECYPFDRQRIEGIWNRQIDSGIAHLTLRCEVQFGSTALGGNQAADQEKRG